MRLVAVDAVAAALGLAPGFTLKEARRIAPDLLTAPQDAEADAALARRLTALCRRTAPSVARDGPQGFVLDVTGAARAHGGETAMAAAAAAHFTCAGVQVRWALADTSGLAWAASLFGAGGVVAPGQGATMLASLPVEALRLADEDLADLRALGFRRIGPLLGRRELSRALEGRLSARLDVVLGSAATALAPEPARPRYVAARALPQPVVGAPSVLAWTRRLAEALAAQLLAHGRGARALELTLTRVDGERRVHHVRTRSPQTDPAALTRLFEAALESLSSAGRDEAAAAPGSEIDALRLEARLTAPLRAVAGDLLHATEEACARRFDGFVESLTARLGEGVVEAPRRDPATLKPEREIRLVPLQAAPRRLRAGAPPPSPPPPAWGDAVLRPVRLFDPPESVTVLGRPDESPPFTFAWRRLRRRVVRAEGPERLAPEWGREPEGARTRDYYRVEDEQGRRYWLYREGLYGDETHPAWFIQGVFS